jgi:transposase
MRFVPVKSVAPHEVQALHRVRERLLKARAALMNATRGLLSAYGSIVPQGATTCRKHVREKLATEGAKLPPRSRGLFPPLPEEWGAPEARVATHDAQLPPVAPTHPVCRRLLTMPGPGELSATALGAAVSDATPGKNGRPCAAWLGLAPRHRSTGGKVRLLGSSTQGDS